ncbi:hypothetical protein B0H12DRAFT_1071584 [Mycena haematopus]|nr:hypothetical protein B0H12DRAFT_1071584 [Mycena haematopus]
MQRETDVRDCAAYTISSFFASSVVGLWDFELFSTPGIDLSSTQTAVLQRWHGFGLEQKRECGGQMRYITRRGKRTKECSLGKLDGEKPAVVAGNNLKGRREKQEDQPRNVQDQPRGSSRCRHTEKSTAENIESGKTEKLAEGGRREMARGSERVVMEEGRNDGAKERWKAMAAGMNLRRRWNRK